MPEGPEVRHYADRLQKSLAGKPIRAIDSRLRVAREWLESHPGALTGRRIHAVEARGKNLIIRIEGGYFIHSHLMMWGRWEVRHGSRAPARGASPTRVFDDRRVRARISVPGRTAILYSAPVFTIGQGDPFRELSALSTLGPDALPVGGPARFDDGGFLRRLLSPENRGREIGVALLDQRIVAGIGNYLRAEILFLCGLDPWILSEELTRAELDRLCEAIPGVCDQAYRTGGITVTPALRRRMLSTPGLTYRPGSDYGSRHYVFRRTNRPCLRCGTAIRQLRQVTLVADGEDEDDKSRITYFCPVCQASKGVNMTRIPSSPFTRFAETARAIQAESGRNEKSRILGGYLRALSEADLVLAARFFSGDVFPLYDQRTTQIGGAALLSAIGKASGLAREELKAKLVLLGDVGDVAGEALSDRSQPEGTPPTLEELYRNFEALALPGQKNQAKVDRIASLLARLEPEEAKYLIKLLAGDLRIGLKEGAVEASLAMLHEVPVARIQRANLLTGDIGEVARLARAGSLDSARFRMFHPLKFMLASPSEDDATIIRSLGERFLAEHKFDGIRAQVHVAPEKKGSDLPLHGVVHEQVRVAIFSRTMDEITESFPELVPALAALGKRRAFILDGEIVPLKQGKVLPFLNLQKRLGRKKVDEALLREVPCSLIVFDVLYSGDVPLLDEPLRARRKALEKLALPFFDPDQKAGRAALLSPPRVLQSTGVLMEGPEGLDAAFTLAREAGNEGLMLKDLSSAYKPGRRGKEWLKVKRALATLDVVVTAVEVGNGRRRHLLSDFTFAVRRSEADPTLLNVGKAYSGLTDAELGRLTEWFKEHTRETFAHGKVRVVEPRIVIEVTFDAVQESKRHKGGYALRFPRIVRLREDKPVSEIDTLETVRALASSADGGRAGPRQEREQEQERERRPQPAPPTTTRRKAA